MRNRMGKNENSTQKMMILSVACKELLVVRKTKSVVFVVHHLENREKDKKCIQFLLSSVGIISTRH